MFDSAILNGTLVTSENSQRVNIYIQDGKIAKIGPEVEEAKEVIRGDGKHIFPGFIDPHVHSRDGGATYKEDFWHSTRAAALGGLTTIVEMPNAVPAVTDEKQFTAQKENLEAKAYIDFAMWALCLGKQNNKELKKLDELGAAGFKFFWGYAIQKSNYNLVYNYEKGDPSVIAPLDDGEIFTIFEEMGKIEKPLGIHAENASLIGELTSRMNPAEYKNEYEALLAARPSVCEETIINTALSFARVTGAKLHILHMSAREGVELLKRAKEQGILVTGETAPHYLFLTNEDFERVGTKMKGYPPVRFQADQDALWKGLKEGVIDSIGSDHAPHTAKEKEGSLFKIPAGMCCIETLVPLMIQAVREGRISENKLAAVLSENTARLYGLYPQKGSVKIGTDADFTIVDYEKEKIIRSEEMYSISKISAFDNIAVKGIPVQTIVRGTTVMKDGKLTLETSRGQFVKSPSRRRGDQKNVAQH